MNSTVSKTINGRRVSARPVFKGGALPAYWIATVDGRSLPKLFDTPREAIRCAAEADSLSLLR